MIDIPAHMRRNSGAVFEGGGQSLNFDDELALGITKSGPVCTLSGSRAALELSSLL